VECDGDEVVFSVMDQGPGIAPGDIPRLFHRFSRIRPAGKEDVPGSGLGLNISRRITEAHGGRMWVESEPGKGSRFSLALPMTGQRS
jgi:signal transduction histidine kinase